MLALHTAWLMRHLSDAQCLGRAPAHVRLERCPCVQKDVLHQAHLRLRAHAHHATREQAKLQGRLHATRTEWAAASQANQNMVNELRKLRMQLVRQVTPVSRRCRGGGSW